MGVEKRILRAGKGPKPSPGQTVMVICTGYGKNNHLTEPFYSTKKGVHKPVTFKIGAGHVIKAWDEGVLEMRLGELARLKCTPDYAFGDHGFPEWGILPNSVLEFEMELVFVK